MSDRAYDFVITGAGVVGLTIARELQALGQRILILEKEADVGIHASGRNSGVLHAGLYYASDSFKARFCAEGRDRWVEFAREHGVPYQVCGKVIVATKPETVQTLDALKTRARENGVRVEEISLTQLKELEPEAHSFEKALWSPHTAIIDSKTAMKKLKALLIESGCEIWFDTKLIGVDMATKRLTLSKGRFVSYGCLINAAGVYADRVAQMFGVGHEFRILPFKGLYWKATAAYASRVRGLIYPAPDLNMPFLGVHLTKNMQGDLLLGPTAIPAFGRENYSFWGGLNWADTSAIGWRLLQMGVKNQQHFRRYVREESMRYLRSNFLKETQRLTPSLGRADIGEFAKVGIRAQLMDVNKKSLVMDFILRPGPDSFHIINSISPAFTSAPAFAVYIVNSLGRTPSTSQDPGAFLTSPIL